MHKPFSFPSTSLYIQLQYSVVCIQFSIFNCYIVFLSFFFNNNKAHKFENSSGKYKKRKRIYSVSDVFLILILILFLISSSSVFSFSSSSSCISPTSFLLSLSSSFSSIQPLLKRIGVNITHDVPFLFFSVPSGPETFSFIFIIKWNIQIQFLDGFYGTAAWHPF